MKFEFKIFLNLSIGVFLFILFLQPFEFKIISFNNRLLFVSGFGGITLVFMALFHMIIPRIFKKLFKTSVWEVGPPVLISFLVWTFNSVAFSFYLRYVGATPVSIFVVFKIILICIAPVIIVRVIYKERFQNYQIQDLLNQNKKLQLFIKENQQEKVNDQIDIFSENNTERLSLTLNELLFIKSADNYIAVHYNQNGEHQKKMIRNTLKNIETILRKYPNIIRCHRTCIVNTDHIEKLSKNFNGYNLQFSKTKEEVPVSRQYLLRIKEVME